MLRRQADKVIFAPAQIFRFLVDPAVGGKNGRFKDVILIWSILYIKPVTVVLLSSDVSISETVGGKKADHATSHVGLQHRVSCYQQRPIYHFSDFCR